MRRVVISFLLLAVMLAGMMNVWAAEAEITVQVCTSKTEVQVGETVEYTVLATGSGVVAMQFEVRLPEGLRYVPNSGATPENLAQKLGVPAADWTEQSMMFTFYNDIGITFAEDTEILRFSCVAEKTGEWEVELYELLPFDGNFEEFSPKLQVQKVRVTGQEPPMAPTVPEETLPAVSPEMEPSTSDPKEPATSSNPETLVETTPAASVPDQTEDQMEENPVTDPLDQPQDTITIGASQDVQTKEEDASKTGVWVWIVSGVAAVAIGAVIFIIVKKKRV